ncbi:serine/threonine-protein phosphatase 2A regulatory subunit B'' subunit beta isoform X3 [Rhinoderma darwinii]|uniref:serine/threonine-protein phosphatase 2A regulatory subunit B'' subunit beta isoform X3 n=1 Tax=Rhinoderma darwinii TaxID=43563 RepID=UPI003F66A211
MPANKVLQPALKMKVDELFLYWLSETPTQLLLKDYLRRIKNGENVMPESFDDSGDASRMQTANKMLDNLSISPVTCSPPSRSPSALPIGAFGSPRSGLTPRTRRSNGSRLAQPKREEPRTPTLSQHIPKFYFPKGCPKANVNVDSIISKIEKTFSAFPNERASLEDMSKVAKACECPLYWKAPLFYAAGGDRTGHVSVHKFVAMWRKVLQTCHDDAAKFVQLLAKPGCVYLEQEDFIPFLQDVVNTHTHLTFLREASEFHSRYITTVVQRIFYVVNRSWSGRITCAELRKSNFLQHVALLEEEDINQSTDYFSYEHFYVIYCKFWELDTDHDLYIDEQDLSKHSDNAISSRIIERIFSGAVTRAPESTTPLSKTHEDQGALQTGVVKRQKRGRLAMQTLCGFSYLKKTRKHRQVLSTGFAVWILMEMESYQCMSWSTSMRNNARRWRAWPLSPYHLKTVYVRCWILSNLSVMVKLHFMT